MKSNRILLPALAACCLLASSAVRASDWPHWRGPDYNGVSKETGWSVQWPESGPKQLWEAQVGIGFSTISVAAGRACTTGNRENKDSVFCFDADTGKPLWQYTYDAPLDPKYYEGGTSATPTLHDGRVYSLGKRGWLACLKADNGEVVWAKNIAEELGAKMPEWGFAGSVVVQGDKLFINVGRAGAALDKSGKVIWKTGPEASGYATPVPAVFGGQKTLVVFGAKAVSAVHPETGAEIWTHPWKTSYDVNAADPIISGDLVFISSGYNRGAAVLKITDNKPSVVWESKVMRNQHNNCVLIQNHLYGFDGNDNCDLKCVELQTGDTKWAEKGLGKGALMAADGKLVVLSEKGELVIAPAVPSGFKASARAQILSGKCWTMPVLSNGRVYARNAAGRLVCVDVRGK